MGKRGLLHAAIAALLLCAQLLALVPGAAAAPVVGATITVGGEPVGVGVNPVTGKVYVANGSDGSVSVIDEATDTVMTTLTVGGAPRGVGINSVTNVAYVANSADDSVSVIDGATDTVATTVTVGDGPYGVGVNPVTDKIYVSNGIGGNVSVIDAVTNTVTATVAVGSLPRGVGVNPVTNKVYVSNWNDDSVSVIDGSTDTVATTVTVGDGPREAGVNPVTNLVYVANAGSGNVSVIDGSTDMVTATVAVGGEPEGLSVNPAANKVYVSNWNGGTVSVIDGSTEAVSATLAVGNNPWGVGSDPATGKVYVANNADGTVSVIEDEDIVPFSDEFTETTLDPAWTWTDPLDDCDYSLTANPGHLRISVPDGGHDFWPAVNYNAPRVTQLVGGDFSIETRVLFDPQYHAQQAGILVWRDNDNFLLLNRRCSNEGQIVIYGADAGGTISSAYAAYSDTTTYLRMVRQGDVFSFLFGNDGISWSLLGSTTLAVTDPVEVGLLVMDQWQDNPISADFDYFRFNQHSVSASVVGGGGTVSPATQVVTRGTAAVVDLTPDPGCYVASVTDNGSVVTPTPTDTYVIPCVDNNREVVVTFSPFSDEFSADPLNPGWTWTDPLDDCDYSLTVNPGYLRVSNPGSGHDLSPYNTDAPRVLQLVGGDFVIETSVLFNTASSSQGAGLLFFKDFDNYLRLERGCWSGPDVLMYGEVGGSTVSAETPFTGVPTFLRMARVGDAFSTYCSTDGTGWTLVGSTTLAVSDPVQVGLDVTQLTTNDAIYADFDYFRFITTVTSIDPTSGTNDGVVSGAAITGTGFREGAAVSLRKLGQDDIAADNVTVVSDTRITCDLDLTGVIPGTWDVVVTNPDAQEGVLPFGFRVSLGWGSLQAWGDNTFGKCNVPAGNDFTAIAAGYQHNLALRADGSIAAWGDDAYGQCNAPGGTGFAAVAAGGYHSLALRSDGSLVGWGDNGFGQINVPTGYDFVGVSAGHYFSTALRSNGSVVAWGQDAYGQLTVPAGNDFVALDTGDWHSMALRSDGSVVAWGENTWGQCNVPADDYTAVAAGWVHSVALRANGSLAAWGFNGQGECDVPAGSDFVAVSSGADHGLGLRADGSITCWGYNVDHQADTPPGNDFVAVSGGYSHSLAIVQHPAPTVGSITPDSGIRGEAVNVTDLAGTGFYGTPTVLLRKTGQDDIAATNVVVVSGTQITCDLDLDGADLGDWDVVVVNPDAQEGSLGSGFTVLIGPLEVDSVTPDNGAQGSTVNITITGKNLDNVNSVVFSGSGISVSNINVVSPTSVTCRLSIGPAAPVGPRDITVSASDGKTDTLAGAVEVKIGAISVTGVTPPSGKRGSTIDVTITGKYFDNVDEVVFSPAGIDVSNLDVVSPTSVTCTLDLTGAAPGPFDIRLNASDGRTGTLADCFTVEPSPLSAWYLAEGSTDWGFDCYVSVVNPNDSAVQVKLTYMTSTGPVTGPTVNMPAMSQATVFPSATLGAKDFSTKVECLGGQAISVDRTMYWTGAGAPCSEAHCATGVTAPAATWYMPEGSSAWGFECFLLIQNPNASSTQATVTWMIQGGSPQTNVFTIGANSRATYNMADYIGAADASIQVTADKPVICERAMYRDSRREGHDSGGTTTPAQDYYLAEGCSGFGFTTWVLVQNPQPTPTDVTIYYQAAAGPVTGPSFTMPPNSRVSINVNDTTAIPGPDPSFSTRVHGSQPIIAERAMYWNGGADGAQVCHDSIGLDAPHTVWYLADGQSSEGRETWTLVQNPNTSAVTVRITYMTPTGVGNVTRDETIPANSRRSFNMADHSGISGRAAIVVECTTAGAKVMCERAMYWNDRGAGTDTIGGYSD